MQPIGVDSLAGKRLFLDFWKLPYFTATDVEPDVSIVIGDKVPTAHTNALVLLPHHGEPELFTLENGIYIFARVRRMKDYPSNLQPVTRIFDAKGSLVSFILKDPVRKVFYLPFFLDEVLEGFYFEKYICGRETFLPKALSDFYYLSKSLVPVNIRTLARRFFAKAQQSRSFPRWPLETSLEDFKRFILKLLLSVSKRGKLPFIWFWPNAKEFCLLLTHDVETGFSNNGGISRLISLEKGLGFRSSYNVVPFKYPVGRDDLLTIEAENCEVGVHGYSHDARLFSSWDIFRARIEEINKVAKEWGAAGFRSASTYRNPYWFNLMRFDYDSSFFDTDPYEPQPGGCLSLFPFFVGNIVEMPLTMPQDHTLFVIRRERDIGIWLEKVSEIKKRNGLVCLVVHPDKGYITDEDKLGYYSEFLKSLEGERLMWNPLPREAAQWWRKRQRAQVVVRDGHLEIAEGTPEMRLKWARVVDDELLIEESFETNGCFSDEAGSSSLI